VKVDLTISGIPDRDADDIVDAIVEGIKSEYDVEVDVSQIYPEEDY
jgi:hypothetical protein